MIPIDATLRARDRARLAIEHTLSFSHQPEALTPRVPSARFSTHHKPRTSKAQRRRPDAYPRIAPERAGGIANRAAAQSFCNSSADCDFAVSLM